MNFPSQTRLPMIESLESRALFNASPVTFHHGALLIRGESFTNIAVEVDGANLKISFNGFAGAEYATVAVHRIQVNAGVGDQSIKIGGTGTAEAIGILTVIRDAPRVETISAGAGPTFIYARRSAAEIIAGPGANYIFTGPQSHVIRAGTGNNTFVYSGTGMVTINFDPAQNDVHHFHLRSRKDVLTAAPTPTPTPTT